MNRTFSAPAWQQALILLTATVVATVTLAALYWVQDVLVPVALAVYLAFVLNPAVRAMQRGGLPRAPAVLIAVTVATVLLVGVCTLVTSQVGSLLKRLPDYRTTIVEKVRSARKAIVGSDRLQQVFEEIENELKGNGDNPNFPKQPGTASDETPVVKVAPEQPPWVAWITEMLKPVLSYTGMMLVSLVLAMFMLFNREDLRNRFLWMFGDGRVTSTTKAMDDATKRISRFLLAQAVVNVSFGLALGVGLYFCGVEYSAFWGVLAAVLRYVPYIGPWVAAVFPLMLSVAVAETWSQPLAVLVLVLILEGVTNNIAEPFLYGHSMGVSGLALLIAAGFWAWLWGPIGLVLSAPLTIVLVVLGKHVPYLRFINVLLSDEPVLEPEVVYYQRLIARDPDEAAGLVLGWLKKSSDPESVFDQILVPALSYARDGRDRGELTPDDEEFVTAATQEILDDLRESNPEMRTEPRTEDDSVEPPPESDRIRILGLPVRDETDAAALRMFQSLLDPKLWDLELGSAESLSAERAERVAEDRPALICISSLAPGGLARTRYLCKRLRARNPDVKLLVGRWGLRELVDENEEHLSDAGADIVATSLLDARARLDALHSVLRQRSVDFSPHKRPNVRTQVHST